MPYVLTLFVLAPHGDLDISQQFYSEIKEANEGLSKVVAVEEKFDALMENFVELESTILALGARHLAFGTSDVIDFIEHRNTVGRRIANVLSSGRLYRDALPQHVLHLLGRGHAEAKAFISKSKDLNAQPMALQMVEALRNYVQHKELPLSGLTFHNSRDLVEKETVAFSSWLEPQFDAVAVSKSRSLRKDVVMELAKAGGKAKAMPLLREYIEHVGAQHQEFRTLIKPKEDVWESSLSEAQARYKENFPKESTLGLGVGFKGGNGLVSDREWVSEQQMKYRRYLRIKHLTAVNFSKRYVKWSA